jgi:hypothetical protein
LKVGIDRHSPQLPRRAVADNRKRPADERRAAYDGAVVRHDRYKVPGPGFVVPFEVRRLARQAGAQDLMA